MFLKEKYRRIHTISKKNKQGNGTSAIYLSDTNSLTNIIS
jgi:hypothetical protein